MDIGSAVSRAVGVTERQLHELARYETSDAFDEDERLAIDLAVAMLGEPVEITPVLRERLRARFSHAQLVELASYIAWEHYRSRFNRALGVQAVGFSDGAVCVLPEHRPPSAPTA
jgi:alkylhydroperoxidase family enzyme